MTTKQLKYAKSYYNRNNGKAEWGSFDNFLTDVGTPAKSNMRLIRKCLTCGYKKGNIGWATKSNYSSRYIVKTTTGNLANLRSACEQDGVKYHSVINYIRGYELNESPQAVFQFAKLDKNAKKMFRRNAFASAIKSLT